MKGITMLLLSTSVCLAAASPLPASAQGVEIMRKTVLFAGQMHGAESRCKDYDKAKLDEMRRAQKQRALETGLSSADFEAAWALGYEDARQKMGSLSEPERIAACKRLRSAAGMRPKG